jgi:general secretion pathway protein I
MRRAAFTLIEVMVAVAILGLGLASLFTSQAGAIKVAQRARSTTVATLLARCKMGEIEELVQVDGLPFDDRHETDECCEDAEHDNYECEWSVERIVLPDQSFGDGGVPAEGPLGGSQGGTTAGAGDSDDGMGFDSMMGGESDVGGITSMLTDFTYPLIKPIVENQVRRATVTVRWEEGSSSHEFDVVQFLVSDKAAVAPDTSEEDGTGTAPGSGAGQ